MGAGFEGAVVVGAAAGAGALAGAAAGAGAGFGWMETSSTSKTRAELGPITGGLPAGPYARSEGIKTCHLDPTGIS